MTNDGNGLQMLSANRIDAKTSTQPGSSKRKGQLRRAEFPLAAGDMFINPFCDTVIKTPLGEIAAGKNSLLLISVDSSLHFVRVTSFESGGKSAKLMVEGQPLAIDAGQEIVLSRETNSESLVRRADGVGRRGTTMVHLNSGITAHVSDVAIVTLLARHKCLRALANPQTPAERSIASRLLKIAAALDQVTRYRGPYTAHSLPEVSTWKRTSH
jgi:hypothetical protein